MSSDAKTEVGRGLHVDNKTRIKCPMSPIVVAKLQSFRDALDTALANMNELFRNENVDLVEETQLAIMSKFRSEMQRLVKSNYYDTVHYDYAMLLLTEAIEDHGPLVARTAALHKERVDFKTTESWLSTKWNTVKDRCATACQLGLAEAERLKLPVIPVATASNSSSSASPAKEEDPDALTKKRKREESDTKSHRSDEAQAEIEKKSKSDAKSFNAKEIAEEHGWFYQPGEIVRGIQFGATWLVPIRNAHYNLIDHVTYLAIPDHVPIILKRLSEFDPWAVAKHYGWDYAEGKGNDSDGRWIVPVRGALKSEYLNVPASKERLRIFFQMSDFDKKHNMWPLGEPVIKYVDPGGHDKIKEWGISEV